MYTNLYKDIIMIAMTYSNVRKDLANTMQKVCNDHDAVIITRRNASPVVMISLEEYESLTETQFLLSSPNNRNRLESAIASLEKGLGTERELLD